MPEQSFEPFDPKTNYRVYGWLLDDKFLLKYALEHHLGTDEDAWQQRISRSRAAEVILDGFKLDPYMISTVVTKKGFVTCAAIASETYFDYMPMPPKEKVQEMKKLMRTEKEPRWYHHV
ncbi:hypothetical protein C8R46DRAFT_1211148 [Mycena filopes]|nr:hypothetical protein C8R46DRAFT_1211148 [Mycena filopes]